MSVGFLLSANCRTRYVFRFNEAALLQKHTSASFVNLGHAANVFQTLENAPRSI
jgi:hypothetical protein